MKTKLLIVFALFVIVKMQAQVLKTVNVTTSGTLSSLLTTNEKSTVTNLTITGTIDKADFVTMRSMIDSYKLTVIDLSGTQIVNNVLPDSAFMNRYSHYPYLKSISIPSSITSISNSAFSGCYDLTTISMPSSLTTIGDFAFKSCSALTTISLPTSVTSIGEGAFTDCYGLTSISLPSSITEINAYLFQGCKKLNNVSIPSSVTTIGMQAFLCCTGLTSITIPSSVTTIEMQAFEGCTGLTSITILKSITSLGFMVFAGCNNLKSIKVYSKIPLAYDFTYDGIDKVNCILYVPVGSIREYVYNSDWGNFKNIVEFLNGSDTLKIAFTKRTSQPIQITENGNWTISSNASWIHLSTVSGTGIGTFTISTDSNNTGFERKALVLVSVNGNTDTVTVIQECFQLPQNPTFKFSATNINNSGFTSFYAKVPWSATINQTSWVTMDTSSTNGIGKIKITVTDNLTNVSRTAVIIYETKYELKIYTVFQEAGTGTSVEIESVKTIAVYPNPTSSELTIDLKDNIVPTSFYIANMQGQTLYSGKLTEITTVPMQNFPTGVYTLLINNGKQTTSQQIIKQ